MIEDAQALNENEEAEAASQEEIASANDIMLAMVRTAKGLRIYLPNNPVLIKFLDELSAKMTAHLDLYGDFKLVVERFALSYKGAYVYENQDARESIAFRLHADGINSLRFKRGLQQDELTTLLGIIGFDRTVYEDDDIVTRLWEQGLPHVSYLLEEDFVEVYWDDEEVLCESQQEAISRICAAVASNPPPPPQTIPAQMLVLNSEEADWLRKANQAEAQRSPLDDVIHILSAILAGVKSPEIFEEFVGIMANLTANMFLAGDIVHALRLVRFLDKLIRLGNISPDQRQLVSTAVAGILTDRCVEVLQETIDGGDTVSHDDLKELLQIFGINSLGAICELLGRVEKLKMRKVIIEVLVELGRDDPQVFAPVLSDPRWYLVRNVVLVLSLMDTAVALEMIVGLVSHKEARIRKEVLGFLERSSDPKAKAYILKFLRDESSALRIKALQILAREGLSFGLKPALALATAPDFKSKDIAEKKAIYEAIGELGSEQVIPLFSEMLLKKQWFRKSLDKETAICAVAGLMKMRNAAALQLLEDARNQRSAEIRGIIEQAISAIASGQARAVADPGEV
jgi:hypothetical protein